MMWHIRAGSATLVLMMFTGLFGWVGPCEAQNSATLQGTVRDSQGAPVTGAMVTVTGSNVNRSTVTGARGHYRFKDLPPGLYTVSASLAGFATARMQARLRASQSRTLDFTLSVGKMQESVTVAPAMEIREIMAAPPPRPAGRPTLRRLRAPGYAAPDFNTEAYAFIEESGFVEVKDKPLSTFSIDVDTASYSNVRRFLNDGRLPPPDAVRVEELINYFSYDYPSPRSEQPFSVSTEVAACPWQPDHRLVQIGLQGRRIDDNALPPRNLVFLIDVSGSMRTPNKLPLLKRALGLLAGHLTQRDRVAIVVYAGSSGLVLPSTPGDDREAIEAALAGLHAGGSTNGGQGIQLAYRVATENFVKEGVNRVMLATDGDFNVGVTSHGDLMRLIEQKRKTGVFLSVLGFGQGNLKDSTMESLAGRGNGNYAYIDTLTEARKVLVSEAAGTLVTLAKDVKIQVEFNPARVEAYRLVGYENRRLRDEDFDDDTKDAGEIGAGHTVTALYEIIPRGKHSASASKDLRYQAPRPLASAARSEELLRVQLRFKPPDGDRSRLISEIVRQPGHLGRGSANLRFASAVAAFGMLLRDSEYKGAASFDLVRALAEGSRDADARGHRAEFIRLVELARDLKSPTPKISEAIGMH